MVHRRRRKGAGPAYKKTGEEVQRLDEIFERIHRKRQESGLTLEQSGTDGTIELDQIPK